MLVSLRSVVALALALALALPGFSRADEPLEVIRGVELQPLAAQAKRVAQALDQMLGSPLSKDQQAELDKALTLTDADKAAEAIQKVFDPLCLVGVNINPESRVKVARGPAAAKLMQSGWRVFLVKVHNEAGVTAQLRCLSPNAPVTVPTKNSPKPKTPKVDTREHWLAVELFDKQPLNARLSGLALEYRILALYSRDAGKREAKLMFDVGQGTQDLGFRNEVAVLFAAEPAVEVKLEVIDHDGKPTMGQFVIRDAQNRVYPSRLRRLAPDLFFHDQVYRNHGESVTLPPGKYNVTYTRGPEYRIDRREITVPDRTQSADKTPHTEAFRLRRWIKLADYGWFSGDHHVHAAGCKHYEVPTQGVTPADMMRHILGEDLNVGCVLTWGPCWYHQKQFFSGEVDQLSSKDYLMRYDVEVSGFPSQHAGHLCLLRLKEDDYTYPQEVEFDWAFGGERGRFKGRKTELIGEWPTWDLPILKWGKEQGGVVGFSHSGWGLKVNATSLPTYEMPPFDGIGANEFIVDTVHGVCHFISAVDTPSVWELNIWYHTLNCGFTTRISGETDFPCIYGERVGLGRGYVKLNKDEPLTYDNWVYGIRDGRSYCCDGLSHLFDFTVNGLGVGEVAKPASGKLASGGRKSPDSAAADDDHYARTSRLSIKSGEKLSIKVRSAAFLEEKPKLADDRPGTLLRDVPLDQKPYWHVERSRIGDTRKVPVELIVNGIAVEKKEIEADGKIQDLTFDYTPKHSSWVALRIFPSCHTNPVFVEVDGKPIRASKRSADWCLKAVDVCWNQKVKQTRESEKEAAAAAYEVARKAYRKVLEEAVED
jgi:hypothetical protein